MKFILIFSLVLSQAPIRHSQQRWGAANFRGLIVGKSNRAAMLRILGQPKWSRAQKEEEADEDAPQEVWNNYDGVGEFPGPTTVVLDKRTGVIIRIDFFPEKLTREQAIAHFGRNYITMRYDFDPCPGSEEDEPVYESPSGPLTSIEYRARGIAVLVGYKNLVTKISYVSGPIGATKPKCK